MRTFLVIACTLLCLTSCTDPRPTVVNITPVSTITTPEPRTEKTEQEQRIEAQLLAPEPTKKFREGAPVRLPMGCEEGRARGVDC